MFLCSILLILGFLPLLDIPFASRERRGEGIDRKRCGDEEEREGEKGRGKTSCRGDEKERKTTILAENVKENEKEGDRKYAREEKGCDGSCFRDQSGKLHKIVILVNRYSSTFPTYADEIVILSTW